MRAGEVALRVAVIGVAGLCLPASAQAAWQSALTGTPPNETATMGGSEDLIIDASAPKLRHNRGGDPGFHNDFDFDSNVALEQTLANVNTNTVNTNGFQTPDVVQLGSATVPASQIVASFTFNATGSSTFHTDDFTLDNSADTTARSYQVGPGQITGHGGGSVSYSSASTGTFTIRLKAGSAGDEVGVQPDTPADPPYAFEVVSGGGDDRVTPANNAPVPAYNGGPGTDTLSFAGYSSAASFALTSATSVENLLGGPASDSLTGDGNANRIEGAGGADSLSGADGDDVLAAVDGVADAALDCGPGAADVANVDGGLDPAPTNCETVNSVGGPSPDPDTDGDGVPDSADSCPTVAGPAANNGCPTGPLPDGDGDGFPDTADRCPVIPGTRGGCPPVERRLTIDPTKDAFEGKLRAQPDVLACEEGQKVTVFRKRKGADPKVGSDRTNSKGAFEVDAPHRDGKYYAQVKEIDEAPAAICLAAKSKNLTLG